MLWRILLLLLVTSNTFSQSPIYYLSVGSGHYYFSTTKPGYTNYEQLPEAVASARIMADVFRKYGKGKGITLLSSNKKLINKADILTAMDQLWQMMQQDKATNPLIIFYLSGHGFADSLLQSQFLLSGNYPAYNGKDLFTDRVKENLYIFELLSLTFLKSPNYSFKETDRQIISAFNNDTIAISLITRLIKNFKPASFMIMMDCCRNPLTSIDFNAFKMQQLYGKDKAPKVNATYTSMLTPIKFINDQVLANLAPVIFSGKNMEAVEVVPYPAPTHLPGIHKPVNEAIAPICQKTLQLLNKYHALNLKNFIKLLVTANGESNQTPVTSFDIEKIYPVPLFNISYAQ